MSTIDDLLDAIRQAESGGNNKAVSRAGAKGPYQFMPSTAREFGLEGDDVFDPVKSRVAAKEKVNGLLDQYGGDTPMAIAAYNLGQGNLRKVGGDYNRVPETKNYVNKVLNLLNPISTAQADKTPWTEESLLKDLENNPQPAKSTPWTEEELLKELQATGGDTGGGDTGEWQGSVGNITPESAMSTFLKTAVYDPQKFKDASLGFAMGLGKSAKGVGEFFGGKMTPENQSKWDALKSENDKTGVAGSVGQFASSSVPSIFASLATGGATIPLIAGQAATGLLTTEGDSKDRVFAAGLAGALSGFPAARKIFQERVIPNALDSMSRQKIAEMVKSLSDAFNITIPTINTPVASAPDIAASVGKFSEGIKPTAAMVTTNPDIADLETLARLTNKSEFFNQDSLNKTVIARLLKLKAMSKKVADARLAAVNEITTPMRESAVELARTAGPKQYAGPLRELVTSLKSSPGTRYSKSVKRLTKGAKPFLAKKAKIDPLDIYAYRKELGDALNNTKTLTLDEMANAAKNSAREATLLKQATDQGLNNASEGTWQQYINTHRQGMIPINEGQAWDGVLHKFDVLPQLGEGVPNITPGALRRAILAKTYSKSGRDLLTKTGRSEADKMVNTMNAMERAQSPRAALQGSQTTPLAIALAKKATKLSLPGELLMLSKELISGQSKINAATQNPSKLLDLLTSRLSNKRSISSKYLIPALSAQINRQKDDR